MTTSDIDGWFHADGPGHEYLNKQGIVDLVSVAKGNECDEEEDADENTQHSTQKTQCSFCRPEALQMFDHCLTWLRIQRKQQFQTLPHWNDFASLLLKNANLSASNQKLIPILVDLVLQMIVKWEIY